MFRQRHHVQVKDRETEDYRSTVGSLMRPAGERGSEGVDVLCHLFIRYTL